MFLQIEGFARDLLRKSPSVALLTWKNRKALTSVLQRLGPALRRIRRDTVLFQIGATELDSEGFSRKLLEGLARRDAAKMCLLIYEIEPLVGAAGKILNGFREKFETVRALVVSIREDRRRDLLLACPDMMSWVGAMARAEDLGPPFTMQEIRHSIKELERRHALSSEAFATKWSANEVKGIADAWLWKELLAIRADLENARKR